MNLIERIQLAGSILFKAQTAYEVVPTGGNVPYYRQVRFEKAVTDGLLKNELIWGCIDLKCDSLTQARLCAYSTVDEVELDDNPLTALLDIPNPEMDQSDFKSLVAMHIDLAGASYWEKVRSRSGQVVELWPLRPDWVKPVVSTANRQTGWKYEVPGRAPIPLALGDVLPFRRINPVDFRTGMPAIQAAARAVDTDNAASDFITALLQNGGVPIGFLKVAIANLNKETRERIRAQWLESYGSVNAKAGPGVLDNNVDWVKTGFNIEELGLGFVSGKTESHICSVFRTPPGLVYAHIGLENSTYNNRAEDQKDYWKNTLIPANKRIASSLNRHLTPDFGGGLEIRWDYTEVPAMNEDRTAAWDRGLRGITAGAVTVNEFRGEIGEEATPDGDVYLRTLNMIAVPQKMAGGPLPGQIAEPDNNPNNEAPADDQGDALQDSGKAREFKAKAPDNSARVRTERKMQKAVQAHLDSEFVALKKAIKKTVEVQNHA